MVAESYFWSAAGQEKGTGYFTGVKCLCQESLSERDRKGDRGQEKGTGYFTGVKCLCQESLSERDRKGDRPFEEEGLSPGK